MQAKYKEIANLILEHQTILREHHPNKNKFKSIYDNKVYTEIFIDDLIEFVNILPNNANILDFGCGRGTTSYVLSKLGYTVDGLEVEYKEMDENKTSYVFSKDVQIPLWEKTADIVGKKLHFISYNGDNIPIDNNKYDAIFAYAVLEHVQDLEKTLSELNRISKKKAILFISRTPNYYSYAERLAKVFNQPAHENLYIEKDLLSLIRYAGFQIVKSEYIDFFISIIPIKQINRAYQSMSPLLLRIDKIIRHTPLKLISHHFRIVALKEYETS